MPSDALALSRLFPVMLQVEAVATRRALEPEILDPLVLRRRAFSSLRELLTRMANRRPLVLLHRRSALGGRGQRAPARGVAPAAGAATAPDGGVLPHGRNRVQAVSAERCSNAPGRTVARLCRSSP